MLIMITQPPYDAPSLAYLSTYPKSISIKDTEAALVYLTGLFPVQKIDFENMIIGKQDIYLTYPTQNYVVVKFIPGDTYGTAKMERVGVIMFGRLPAPATWAETIGVASPLSLGITNPLGYLLSYVNGKIAKQLLGSPNVVGWAGYEGKWQKLND
ncbi:hypothetical protein Metvu_0283 [Methanocaldococcus vulcanius M7]|uniref:Uncharacterized protein n=2 Tax=Methanocaldococcus TaxID=196118 RepID=C9REZ8_METVM|nr:hypothetical protein Metvu_0283 [Methanocaldococcus vulcanius M7]